MLANERYSKIHMFLMEHGFAKVEDLAAFLNVSSMTIRRDLEKCQQEGMLQRCHGGAILVGVSQQEVSFDDKSAEKSEVKKQIARICTELVKEGMSVFLDAGTTTYEIAQLIRMIPRLTIVTNDIRIAYSLLNSGVELLLVGGSVQKSTGSVIGQIADSILSQMHLDIAFLGVNSINEQLDVMTPTIAKAYFKRQILQSADIGYLVADDSKFHRNALYRVNSLGDYAGIITNYGFEQWEEDIIRKKKINVIPVQTVY